LKINNYGENSMSMPIHPIELRERLFEEMNSGKKLCPECRGDGYKFNWFFKKIKCYYCNGKGYIRKKSRV